VVILNILPKVLNDMLQFLQARDNRRPMSQQLTPAYCKDTLAAVLEFRPGQGQAGQQTD
jgi:hypothetical protein